MGESKLFILRALCPGVCHMCHDRTLFYSLPLRPLGSRGPQVRPFPEVNNSQKQTLREPASWHLEMFEV